MNTDFAWEWFTFLIYWIPFGFGIFVSVRAFSKTRIIGYLFIGLFFLSPLFGIMTHQISYSLHREKWEQLTADKNAELQEKLNRGEPIEVYRKPLEIPFFEIILAIGVALIANPKQHRSEQTPRVNAAD